MAKEALGTSKDVPNMLSLTKDMAQGLGEIVVAVVGGMKERGVKAQNKRGDDEKMAATN